MGLANATLRSSETSGTIYGVSSILLAIAMLPLCIMHIMKVYQDLYTVPRASVGWRNVKPIATPPYRVINFCTAWAIVFFTLSTFMCAASFFVLSDYACDILIALQVIFLQIGKSFMYYVFLARLYRLFRDSPYNYPYNCLIFFVVLMVSYELTVIIVASSVIKSKVFQYSSDGFPNWCAPGHNGHDNNLFLLFSSLIIIQDVAASIGFVWSFKIPLNKTKRAKHLVTDHIAQRKLLFFGTKMYVLVGTSTVTTTLLFVCMVIFGLGVLSQIDQIVSSLCLMLMTAYYPNKVCYKNCCCICRKVFDKYNDSTITEEQLVEENELSFPDSVDTMSILKKIGHKLTDPRFDKTIQAPIYQELEEKQGPDAQQQTEIITRDTEDAANGGDGGDGGDGDNEIIAGNVDNGILADETT